MRNAGLPIFSITDEVGNEWREFEENKLLVFSDSYPHRVVNQFDSKRVVLIIDFWHKDLTDAEVRCLQYIMTEISSKEGKGSFWSNLMISLFDK